jgi:cytochrome c-type biogenesis protein CcmH/NrfF
MTSFSFHSRIKNGGMASIIFGAFHIFFILYVMLQPAVKTDGVMEWTAPAGNIVAGHATTFSHSKFLS